MSFEETLRARIKTCGKSVYRLCHESGLGYRNVKSFVNGEMKHGINVSTATILAEELGYEIVLVKKA